MDETLREWLPPHYEIVTRRHILTEKGDALGNRETDLLVIHSAYPRALRGKAEILASGVAAAFSVMFTADRSSIHEAADVAAQLRREMPYRGSTIRHELVPPVFYGLLAHSHAWTKPGSDPEGNVANALDDAQTKYVRHPREALDLVCIADLNTWHRQTAVISNKAASAFAKLVPSENSWGEVLTSLMKSTVLEQSFEDRQAVGVQLEAVPVLISSMLTMLAINDETVLALADGLRLTGTSGEGRGQGTTWPLNAVFSEHVLTHIDDPSLHRDWNAIY